MSSHRLTHAYHWSVATLLAGRRSAAAAPHFVKAVAARPHDGPRGRRALRKLVAAGETAAARAICRIGIGAGDPHGYWAHHDSYLAELESARASAPAGDGPRVALFNDTDLRMNIGCRLTSQGLKRAIAHALPGAAIRSLPFRFSAFKTPFAGGGAPEDAAALRARVAHGYGPEAVAGLEASDVVILQPEGSLDDSVGPDGVTTFLAPALLARALGKPAAVMNGTVPLYDGERGDIVRRIFAETPSVAARDSISAEGYGVSFLPDAAFLYAPGPPSGPRDGCLITTGARNREDEDRAIILRALDACDALGLRPIVLTRASHRFDEFAAAVEKRGGVFAETASLALAAESIARCRLHIGARYHMTIFCLVCGVPSVLFDVRTHKNQWLGRYSDLVRLVAGDEPLLPLAQALLASEAAPVAIQDELSAAYDAFLRQAARPAERI